ncbi:MAG: hypothetical protein QM644_18195 [Mobilitalea sp.]
MRRQVVSLVMNIKPGAAFDALPSKYTSPIVYQLGITSIYSGLFILTY